MSKYTNIFLICVDFLGKIVDTEIGKENNYKKKEKDNQTENV